VERTTPLEKDRMKDTELRGLLLQAYYEHRREDWFVPTAEELGVNVDEQDILQVCDQLGQHNLIQWRSLASFGNINAGMGKISAFGIDVVEGEATPDIKVHIVQNNSVNVTGSTNVAVGDHNYQTITDSVQHLVSTIDSSCASMEQKAEAKSLLRKFLEHPLLSAQAGGAIGLLA